MLMLWVLNYFPYGGGNNCIRDHSIYGILRTLTIIVVRAQVLLSISSSVFPPWETNQLPRTPTLKALSQ